MAPAWSDAPLSRWERRGLWLLLLALLGLGGVAEVRTAFLERRMGDLEVFLRTAWAVRDGRDLYAVTDDNGWHYLYPPLFAILMTPLADAPPGTPSGPWTLPFPVTAAVWYLFSLACLAAGVHVLANAVEQSSTQAPPRRFCRRWWALRVVPVLVCLAPIAHTLVRGQVNLLLLALLCGAAAAVVRGQRGRAGGWLAGAVCLKVIPAYLLVYPLWRRDLRCLAVCGIGLLVGLAVIPALVFGPERTVALYREWNNAVIQPGLANGEDKSRAEELIKMTATHSQSFLAVMHNTLYPDWNTRPPEAAAPMRLLHWLLGCTLTALALAAAGWRRVVQGLDALLLLGSLVLLMILTSPICHTHYFCLMTPLLTALLASGWERRPALLLPRGLAVLLTAFAAANVLIVVPGLELVRDLGVATYLALAIWGVAVHRMWLRRCAAETTGLAPEREGWRLAG